jgi:twinkle protein
MSAFENFNKIGIEMVADLIFLKKGRLRSYGDCPACNATQRSGTDKRLPLGVTPNGNGWMCHRCKEVGNMSDLLSFHLCGAKYKDCSEPEQRKIVDWLVQNNFGDSVNVAKKITSTSKILNKKKAEPPKKIDTTSDFRWEADLWRQYKANLYSKQGENVLNWLKTERRFHDNTIDKFDLGMVSIKGVDWLVIPFKDAQGVVVNMKFRSIGTDKKQYRMCSGCPQVLFGSNLLSRTNGDRVIIVEGELDVIAMDTYCYSNIVSSTTGAQSNWEEEWLDMLEPYKSFAVFYDNDKVGDEGALKLAKKIGTYRSYRVKDDFFKDVGELLTSDVPACHVQKILENGEPFVDTKLKRVGSYQERIEQLVTNPSVFRGLTTGSVKLDDILGGVRSGLWVVSGDSGHGKEQPISSPVLTPDGFVPIGEIKIGDQVISCDGKPTNVTGVFPQGVKDIYRVTFSDGYSELCGLDHLWAVSTDKDISRGKEYQVLPTKDLINDLYSTTGHYKWRIPLVEPVQFEEKEYYVDPYVIGVLLGDGCLTRAGITAMIGDLEVIEELEKEIPDDSFLDYKMRTDCNCYRVAIKKGRISREITNLGIRHRAENKFIPEVYKYGSVEQRISLLQGLMDTDGWVDRSCPKYGTSSKQLCDDISELVHSLGGTVRVSSKIPTYTYKGEKKKGLRAYTITIKFQGDISNRLFRLKRKQEQVTPAKSLARKIISIELERQEEAVCIMVDHPSHLYVTGRSYILTHNTTFLTWLVWKQATNQIPVLVTSFEQQPIGTVQKLLRNQLGNDFTKVSKEDRMKAFEKLNNLPIHVYDHYGEIKLSEVIESIRFAARRFDVKIALVDHLGFLVKTDSNTDERQAIEKAVRELATVAVQDDITIMLVCHPNNTSVNQQRRVKITDLKGASAIRQDAHVGIIVERGERDDKSPFPVSNIYLDKCRSEFGQSGAKATLAFDPISCIYADEWKQTPSGQQGRMVVSPKKP